MSSLNENKPTETILLKSAPTFPQHQEKLDGSDASTKETSSSFYDERNDLLNKSVPCKKNKLNDSKIEKINDLSNNNLNGKDGRFRMSKPGNDSVTSEHSFLDYRISSKEKDIDQQCANSVCSNPRKTKRKLGNKYSYFCINCAKIIDSREYCVICTKITSSEKASWVACDSCLCWSHIQCEESLKRGIHNISDLVKQNKYKYYCISCRNHTNPKRRRNRDKEYSSQRSRKSSLRNRKPYLDINKYLKTSNLKKKGASNIYSHFNYTYIFSEKYQTISQLLLDRGFKISNTDLETREDLRVNLKTGDKYSYLGKKLLLRGGDKNVDDAVIKRKKIKCDLFRLDKAKDTS